MSVRVRFAPSPTGYLHIGGARTALYNYLYAKATGGTFILRVEDTDTERSKREYEEMQIADLKWLGIEHDEGPGCPGEYGPYRQSERTEIYKKYADQLVAEKKAFYCFCKDEELEAKKEQAIKEGRDPHYDGTCRDLSEEEVQSRLAAGESAVIRFRVPGKPHTLKDEVRGEVTFPETMVGDFVIMRSNGMPVYNFCCVVDDWLMKITHVIRGEDHLNNTVRQLMIYEALGAELPVFAHVSLLVGKDRQKLSKRHGSTSVTNYREETYLPQSMVNYLCLLGWSHPDEKEVFDLKELESVFNIKRFTKAPATFDIEKFQYINGQHLRNLPLTDLKAEFAAVVPKDHLYHGQSDEWKEGFLNLFKEKVQFYSELVPLLDEVFSGQIEQTDALKEIMSWETTPQIQDYLRGQVKTLCDAGAEYATQEQFNEWSTYIKKELKVKGKPLFMGMRGVLTGKDHGSDLKLLIPLTPLTVLKERIG